MNHFVSVYKMKVRFCKTSKYYNTKGTEADFTVASFKDKNIKSA